MGNELRMKLADLGSPEALAACIIARFHYELSVPRADEINHFSAAPRGRFFPLNYARLPAQRPILTHTPLCGTGACRPSGQGRASGFGWSPLPLCSFPQKFASESLTLDSLSPAHWRGP